MYIAIKPTQLYKTAATKIKAQFKEATALVLGYSYTNRLYNKNKVNKHANRKVRNNDLSLRSMIILTPSDIVYKLVKSKNVVIDQATSHSALSEGGGDNGV